MYGMRKVVAVLAACALLAGCADKATTASPSLVEAAAVTGQAACLDLANPTDPLIVAQGVIVAVAQGASSTDSTALQAELSADGNSSPAALNSDMQQIVTQLRFALAGQPVNIAAVETAADAAAYWCNIHGFAQPPASE